MYKVIIFPGLFYAIKILVFQVVRGGERVKHSPKSKKKNPSVAPYISGTIHHMIIICCTQF